MIEIRTAQNYTIPVNWIGVSDFDGSLRFETPETAFTGLERMASGATVIRLLPVS